LQTSWGADTAANRCVGQVNLAAATNNYWQVTGVQMNVGAVAAPFQFKSYEQDLSECQRYYEKSYDVNTAPGSNTNNGLVYSSGSTDGSGQIFYPVIFKVSKRSNDYAVTFNINTGAAAGNWQVNRNGASGQTTMTNYLPGNNGFVALTGNIGVGWVVANLVGHWVCNAEL
jgi:hypothetical protein